MLEQLSLINPPVLDKLSPDTINNAVTDLFEHINIAVEEHIPTKRCKSIKQKFNSTIERFRILT